MSSLLLYDSSNTPYTFTPGEVYFYKRDTLISDFGCDWLRTRSSDYGNNYNDGTFSGALGNTGWGGQPADITDGIMYSVCRAGSVSNFYNGGISIKDMVQTVAGGGTKTLYSQKDGAGSQWTFDGTASGQYALSVTRAGRTLSICGYDTGDQYYVQMPYLCRFVNETDFTKSPYTGENIGFYLLTSDGQPGGLICCGAFSYGSIVLIAEFEPDPGDKGFRPTGAYSTKNKPGIGGRGSEPGERPRYKGDPVTQPGAPDESQASAVGSGFINCYMIDTANLQKVGQCLYGSTLLGLLQSLSINPLDFIISLMVFPTKPDVGSAENIKLGGWLAAAAGGAALGFDATGNRLASEFKVVDFGTLQIPENWGSFLDYESTIELYLPFIGTVSIDVSECMGGSINVQYTIDFFTGMCVANVLCSKPAFVLPNGDVIQNVEAQHAYQGNCAIQIPLSAINYGNMVGSLINACTQGITNPVAGMINAGETALSGGFRPSVTSKGNIVANSGFCSVLYPYIRITRPITTEPESFQEVLGYPSYINTTLGECEGLCVCEDIDIKGIVGATEEELSRIKSLCSEGVYI